MIQYGLRSRKATTSRKRPATFWWSLIYERFNCICKWIWKKNFYILPRPHSSFCRESTLHTTYIRIKFRGSSFNCLKAIPWGKKSFFRVLISIRKNTFSQKFSPQATLYTQTSQAESCWPHLCKWMKRWNYPWYPTALVTHHVGQEGIVTEWQINTV